MEDKITTSEPRQEVEHEEVREEPQAQTEDAVTGVIESNTDIPAHADQAAPVDENNSEQSDEQ